MAGGLMRMNGTNGMTGGLIGMNGVTGMTEMTGGHINHGEGRYT